MRIILLIIIVLGTVVSCSNEKEMSSLNPNNWEKRAYDLNSYPCDSIVRSYLPVYSQIFSQTESRIIDLTVTISMRNVSLSDSVVVHRAEYYNGNGQLIRSYFSHPIFIKPMETVEIVVDQLDRSGGTGANFIFEYSQCENANEPLFEAVMISSVGQQGLSFSTRAVIVK